MGSVKSFDAKPPRIYLIAAVLVEVVGVLEVPQEARTETAIDTLVTDEQCVLAQRERVTDPHLHGWMVLPAMNLTCDGAKDDLALVALIPQSDVVENP